MRRAERKLVNDDTSLADVIAGALAGFAGVEVATATTVPAEIDVAPPVLFVVQAKASQLDLSTGFMHGKVEVHYYRSKLHSPLSRESIEQALDAANVRADVANQGTGLPHEAGVVDVKSVDVRSAWPLEGLPVIRPVPNGVDDGHQVAWFKSSLVNNVRRSMQAHADALSGHFPVVVEGSQPLAVQDRTKDDVRSRSVEIAFLASPDAKYGTPYTLARIRDIMAQGVQAQLGTCAKGLGRVTDVLIVKEGGDGRQREIVVRFVFESRVPQ